MPFLALTIVNAVLRFYPHTHVHMSQHGIAMSKGWLLYHSRVLRESFLCLPDPLYYWIPSRMVVPWLLISPLRLRLRHLAIRLSPC
jgi:hypothetical protein